MALRKVEFVKCERYDRMVEVSNEGRIPCICQSNTTGENIWFLTRNGWQASNAARNDLGPDILRSNNPVREYGHLEQRDVVESDIFSRRDQFPMATAWKLQSDYVIMVPLRCSHHSPMEC
jgi:hypothetical protein